MRLFKKHLDVIAYPLEFLGEGTYPIRLEKSDYGLVFEDNGETGYLYITNGDHSEILDALHIYDAKSSERLQLHEEAHLVWSPDAQKAGLYYRGAFQAGVDFRKREARCRSGFPPPRAEPWSRTGHEWKDNVVSGLEP